MANTVRDTTTNDKIQLIQSHQTPLNAGKYTITVKQNITVKENQDSFEAKQEFVINGDPFELTPQEIHTVFPPANNLGDHAHNLPHIILNRSTLPWERLAQLYRENAPWLALLVIHDQENQGISPDILPLQKVTLETLENPII
ncbi:MAG TPA: hypothetical protein DCF68_21465 [Cyanothece sp. UBA12306]|nr:hypothetical protein [Cyanothece sp. UBA12306]